MDKTKTMTSFTSARSVGLHHEHNEPEDSSVEGNENPMTYELPVSGSFP